MNKKLWNYGEKGDTPYLVYCLMDVKTLGDEDKFQTFKQTTESAKKLNAGRPFMCSDAGGLTGWMGMLIWANDENDAIEKMRLVRKQFRDADEEPAVWH